MTTKKKTELPAESEDSEVEENPEVREPKIQKLLNFLKSSEDDFQVTIYKKDNRNKRVVVDVIHNDIPDPIKDLRDKYGGGSFRLMVNRPDGSFIDSADVNVAEKIISTEGNTSSPSRTEILQELKMMSDIVGGNNNSGDGTQALIIQMMQMQNETNERFMKMQLDSEKRMHELLKDMKSNQPKLNEFLEIAETINDLRGDGGEKSTMEKLLSNPFIQTALPQIMGSMGGQPGASITQESIAPALQPKKVDYTAIVKQLPEEFKKSVTRENAEMVAKTVYEKNKNTISINDANMIVIEILKEQEGTKNE